MNATTPLSVFVVDDNEDLARSTGVLLDLYGYRVRVALSGEEALAAAAESPPDVALVDIRMPWVDGFELTRKLRERFGEALFVVIVSACGTPDDIRQAHAAGANLHLLKPVDPSTLNDLLRAYSDGALPDTRGGEPADKPTSPAVLGVTG